MLLSSVQKGKLIESQIANMLTLVSDGQINVSIPIVDDDGIDLLVNRKGCFNVVFLQVKSRFVTTSGFKNRLDFQVQKSSFKVSDNFYILCVYFDQAKNEIDTMWLIPSIEVKNQSVSLELHFRIVANRNEVSNDKWSGFKVTPERLISSLEVIL
ncbi:hypothetical protein ABE504_32880 [Paenibacillus oryzisoli]|uniref:hypothetical protein n=1 Tax=Paenibacillus oryzisoli TaxID=1850517 RepID=UPI003D2BF0FE